jgi:hypothetical protein
LEGVDHRSVLMTAGDDSNPPSAPRATCARALQVNFDPCSRCVQPKSPASIWPVHHRRLPVCPVSSFCWTMACSVLAYGEPEIPTKKCFVATSRNTTSFPTAIEEAIRLSMTRPSHCARHGSGHRNILGLESNKPPLRISRSNIVYIGPLRQWCTFNLSVSKIVV